MTLPATDAPIEDPPVITRLKLWLLLIVVASAPVLGCWLFGARPPARPIATDRASISQTPPEHALIVVPDRQVNWSGPHPKRARIGDDRRIVDVEVRDVDGRPAPDACVLLFDPESTRRALPYFVSPSSALADVPHGRTDANGRCRFAIAPTSDFGRADRIGAAVKVFGGDLVSATTSWMKGTTRIGLDLPEVAAVRIRTNARDGASVEWSPGRDRSFGTVALISKSDGFLDLDWIRRSVTGWSAFASPGGLRINGFLLDREFTFAVHGAHPSGAYHQTVTVLQNDQEVLLTPGPRQVALTWTAIDPAGRVIPRDEYSAWLRSPDGRATPLRPAPGGSGAVVEPGVAGTLQLHRPDGLFAPAGRREPLGSLPLPALLPGRRHDLGRVSLPPTPLIVHGEVVDANGRGVARTHVFLDVIDPFSEDPWHLATRTDENGRFEFRRHLSTPYFAVRTSRLVPTRPIHFTRSLRDARLVLEPTGTVAGSLSIAGEFLHVPLFATIHGPTLAEPEVIEIRPDGQFESIPLLAGGYHATLSFHGIRFLTVPFRIEPGRTNRPAGLQAVDLCASFRPVRIHVFDDRGNPLHQASVGVRSSLSDEGLFNLGALTDLSGTAEIIVPHDERRLIDVGACGFEAQTIANPPDVVVVNLRRSR